MTFNAYDPEFWTEERIEREVEHRFDDLDCLLMSGEISQDSYDAKAREIGAWADRKYLGRS